MGIRSACMWRGPWVVVSALCLAAAVGCGPSPIRSQQGSELRNGAEEPAAARLTPGKTTRDEVVGMFGDPDGAAPDDRWMVWTTGYSSGGLRLGQIGPTAPMEKQRYKRLTVFFNERGLVTSSKEDEQSCYGPGAQDPQPMLQPCTGWKWITGEQP